MKSRVRKVSQQVVKRRCQRQKRVIQIEKSSEIRLLLPHPLSSHFLVPNSPDAIQIPQQPKARKGWATLLCVNDSRLQAVDFRPKGQCGAVKAKKAKKTSKSDSRKGKRHAAQRRWKEDAAKFRRRGSASSDCKLAGWLVGRSGPKNF